MKKRYLLAVCMILTLYSPLFAQLTVFNVSSSEITDYKKVSVQEQLEIQSEIESSTTVTYGLGKGWEIGANLINVVYGLESRHFESNDTSTLTPYAPVLLMNAQKVFRINSVLSFGLGALGGTGIRHLSSPKLVYYTYANLNASFGDHDRYQIAAGPYYGNHKYLSDGPNGGFQTGMDLGIWYEKLHILADWISGNHAKGRLTVGIGIFLTKQLPLSLGWQRANVDGSQGGVVQLTFLPK